MKDLRINKISISGIKSYPPTPIDINFESGINIISGGNGSGKTTVFQSVLIGLFGPVTQTAPVNKDKVINETQRMGKIWLEVSIDNTIYTIYREVRKSGIAGDKLFRAPLDQSQNVDGPNPITTGNRNVNNELKKLISSTELEFDIKSVKQIIVSNQREITTLAEGKMESLFKKIHNLEKFDKAHSKLYDIEIMYLGEVKALEKLTDHSRKELEENTSKEKLGEIKDSIDEISVRIDVMQKLVDDKQTELDKLDIIKSRIVQLPELIETTQEELTRIDRRISKKVQEIITSGIKVDDIHENTFLQSLKDWQSKSDENKDKLSELQKEKDGIIAGIDELSAKLEEPKRLQTVNKTKVDTYFSNLAEFIENPKDIENKNLRSTLHSLFKAKENQIQSLNEEKNKSVTQEQEIKRLEDLTKSKNDEKSNYIETKQTKEQLITNEGLNSDFFETFDVENSKAEKERHETEHEIMVKKVNSLKSQIDENNGRISEDKEILEDLRGIDLEKSTLCPTCQKPISEIDISRMIKEREKKISDAEGTNDDLTKERLQTQTKANKFKTEATEFLNKLNQYEKMINEYKDIQNINRRIKKIQGDIDNLKSQNDKISQPQRSSEEIQKIITEETSGSTKIKGLIDSFNKFIENTKDYEKYSKDVKTLESKINDHKHKISDNSTLSKDIQLVTAAFTTTNQIVKLLEELQQERNNKKEPLASNTKLKSELEERKATFDLKKYNELKNLVESRKNEKAGLEGQKRIMEKQTLKDRQKAYEQFLASQKTLKEQFKELDTLSFKHSKVEQIRDCIKAIPGELLKKQRKGISDVATSILRSSFPTILNKIEINVDNDVVVTTNGNKQRIFSQLSGGQQSIVAFALRIAFSRSVTDCQLMIFDEPTDTVDREITSYFVNNFSHNEFIPEQMVIITHNQEFEQLADNVIRLREGTNGFTELVEL